MEKKELREIKINVRDISSKNSMSNMEEDLFSGLDGLKKELINKLNIGESEDQEKD